MRYILRKKGDIKKRQKKINSNDIIQKTKERKDDKNDRSRKLKRKVIP